MLEQRRASSSDYDRIRSMPCVAGTASDAAEEVQALLAALPEWLDESAEHEAWLFLESGEVVGVCAFSPLVRGRPASGYWISFGAVRGDVQQQAIGRKIFRRVWNLLAERAPGGRFAFNVRLDNDRSLKLCKHMGLRPERINRAKNCYEYYETFPRAFSAISEDLPGEPH